MSLMATELANDGKELHIRQAAGLVLKNCLSAKARALPPPIPCAQAGLQRRACWLCARLRPAAGALSYDGAPHARAERRPVRAVSLDRAVSAPAPLRC